MFRANELLPPPFQSFLRTILNGFFGVFGSFLSVIIFVAKLYTNLHSLLSVVGFVKTHTGELMKREQTVSVETLHRLATAEFRSPLDLSPENQEKRNKTLEVLRQMVNAEFYDP